MEKNSFKELESLYIQERGNGGNETKNKIESNIHFFGFIGSIIDLYLPKVGNVLKSLGNDNSGKKTC